MRERDREVRTASAEAAEDDAYFASDELERHAPRSSARRRWHGTPGTAPALAQLVGPDLLVEWKRRLDDFDRRAGTTAWRCVAEPGVPVRGDHEPRGRRRGPGRGPHRGESERLRRDGDGQQIMRKGEQDERVTLERVLDARPPRRRTGWSLSIEQRAEGDHQLDARSSPRRGPTSSGSSDESLTELAVADGLPDGFTTADLAELDFDGDARAHALDLSLADGALRRPMCSRRPPGARSRRGPRRWTATTPRSSGWPRPRRSPSCSTAATRRAKTRLVVRGPRVKRIRIAARAGRAGAGDDDRRGRAGRRRYVEDRDTAAVVSGSKDSATTFTERWTLALVGPADAPWRIVTPEGLGGAAPDLVSVRGTHQARISSPRSPSSPTAPSARFALPSDRRYLPGRHVWARIEDGIATVGVTAPLGEVLWYTPEIEYWAVDRVDVGETLATVQGRSSRTVAVGSPIRGALIELNPLLRRAPHALLAQPYGRGWVARISADRWERDEAGMVSARDYRKILDADLALGREFCFGGALLAPRPARSLTPGLPRPRRARRARSRPGRPR